MNWYLWYLEVLRNYHMIHQTFGDSLNQGARQASCGGSLSGDTKHMHKTPGKGKLSKPNVFGGPPILRCPCLLSFHPPDVQGHHHFPWRLSAGEYHEKRGRFQEVKAAKVETARLPMLQRFTFHQRSQKHSIFYTWIFPYQNSLETWHAFLVRL